MKCGKRLRGAAVGIALLSALRFAAGADGARLAPVVPPDVRVGGEIGRRIDLTVRGNLLALDWDRDFLAPFRSKTAGNGAYVGLGKTLEALIRLADYTRDADLCALKNRVVEELLKTQLPDGYIGTFPEKRRINVYWDLHEMVYVLQALVANDELFGHAPSRAAAVRLADFIMANRAAAAEPRTVGKLNTERAFLALARLTGDARYRDYAVTGANLRQWRDPVAGHAYMYMNLCLAQLDLFAVEPDPGLLDRSHAVLDFLTREDGLAASGTCSHKEGFHRTQEIRGDLGESCATAYLIRLLDRLIQAEGDSRHGDLMERSLYNALFAAQSPDGRRLRYFTPLEGPRPYYDKDTYCCPGNWRRIVAELPGMIYYRAEGRVFVNLYTESAVTVRPTGAGAAVRLRQVTDYPSSAGITLHVEPERPLEFTLSLRLPRWCRSPAARVNGAAVAGAAGQWLDLRRRWEAGDRVELALPMPVRFVRGRGLQAGHVAVMRGPMLFCLAPGGRAAGGVATNALPAPLREIVLDAASAGAPVPDATVRPGGIALPVKGWSPGRSRQDRPDLDLLLREFPDPDGEATYFGLSDGAAAVDDEFLR